MTNLLKTSNLYKLIILIFLIVSIIKIKNQLIMLKAYNQEIANFNEKIIALENQETTVSYSSNSRKDNENMARKDLKMYYPNETPYKGY